MVGDLAPMRAGLSAQPSLAEVAERTTHAVVIADADRRIVWVNQGFTRITGYTMAEVLGKGPGEILQFEKTDAATVERMREALRRHLPFRAEILNRGKSGREYWLDLDIQPQHDKDGVLTGFIAIETEITEQVEARQRLKSVLAALAEGLIVMNQDGEVVEWNPSTERILGMTAEELRGKRPMDRIWTALREDGSDLPPEEYPCQITLSTGRAVRGFVHGVFTPAGDRRWISVSTEPLLGPGGVVTGVVASFTDVTEQREALRSASEKARELDALFDSSLELLCIASTEGLILRLNPEWQRVLGYSPGELTGSTLLDLVHPDDAAITQQAVKRLANGEPVTSLENRCRARDGIFHWIEWRATPLCGLIYAAARDVTDRKAAEAELRKAKATAEQALREVSALRTALDEHSILSVTDNRGRIIDVNTGFCRISGYERDELIGQDHRLLNSGHHDKAFWVNMWRTVASGRAWRGEVCNQRRDGSLYWVDSTIVPYMGPDGCIDKYVSIRFDITAQKAAEAKLLAAQAQAEAANAAKSEFLANMSHEIRTPMTAILGYTDMLALDGDLTRAPQGRLTCIETIRRHGEHLLAIINDILDLSKIEAGKMTVESLSVDPVAMVRDVVALMSVKAQAKGLKLSASFNGPLPAAVRTDPVRLRQILVNLLGNAIKFTESGEVAVAVSCEIEARRLSFAVTDTGIGISPEKMEQLFHAFSQADTSITRRFGGTGLGLRISKRLAEMLGGDIVARSEPGKGSVFTVSVATGDLAQMVQVPEAAAVSTVEQLKPSLPPLASAPKDALNGMRILLAEDSVDNQRLIAFHLRRAGAEVKVVDNGRMAVETLSRDGTVAGALAEDGFDLIVTDMQMPEMDGYAATRLLRSKGCTLPVIALTAHAMSGERERCIEAGCDEYATKPIDAATLVRLCSKLAAEARPVVRILPTRDAQATRPEQAQHIDRAA